MAAGRRGMGGYVGSFGFSLVRKTPSHETHNKYTMVPENSLASRDPPLAGLQILPA